MRRFAILMVVLSLFFFGCISEGVFSDSKQEAIVSADSYDPNNDGIIDFYHYTFAKKTYEGYSIQREIYVSVKNSITQVNFNALSKTQIADALANFAEFSDSVKSNMESCSKKVGIANVKCGILEQCAAKCYESSNECKNLVRKYPEFLGYEVLSLDDANSERIKLTNSINSGIWGYEALSAVEKQKLLDNMRSLYSIGISTVNGPLYIPNTLSLCQNTLQYDGFSKVYSMIGTETLEPDYYSYTVVLTITKEGLLSNDIYSDLFVKDKPAAQPIQNSINLIQQGEIKGSSIEWYPVKSDQNDIILFYSFDSKSSPDNLIWKTPQYKLRSIDLTLLKPSFSIFALLVSVLGYYLAVSVSIALPLIFIILLLNLVILGYSVIVAKIKKYSVYRAVKNFVGVPNLAWRKDIVFGLVLFAIGFGASFFAGHVPDTEFEISRFMALIFTDYIALISVFCSVVGLLFIYTSLQSLVKAEMLQMSYSDVLKRETEVVKREVGELDQRLSELKSLLDEHKKDGFDVSEPYEVYVSIPKESVAKINKDNVEKEGAFIERSLNKIENAVSMMKERKAFAEKNWPEWSKSLLDTLNKEKEMYTSNILFIPISLRSWAINKLIREHQSAGIILDGDLLKIKQEAPTKLVDNIIESGAVLNAIVLKADKPILMVIKSGNKTLVLGLMIKLLSYLKTFLSKSEQKEYKYLMGISNNVVFALLRKGEIDSLIFCPQDKFKEGFEQWKEVLFHIE